MPNEFYDKLAVAAIVPAHLFLLSPFFRRVTYLDGSCLLSLLYIFRNYKRRTTVPGDFPNTGRRKGAKADGRTVSENGINGASERIYSRARALTSIPRRLLKRTVIINDAVRPMFISLKLDRSRAESALVPDLRKCYSKCTHKIRPFATSPPKKWPGSDKIRDRQGGDKIQPNVIDAFPLESTVLDSAAQRRRPPCKATSLMDRALYPASAFLPRLQGWVYKGMMAVHFILV